MAIKKKQQKSKAPKPALTVEERMSLTWTIWNVVEAIILLAAGILSLIYGIRADDFGSNPGAIRQVIVYAIGAFIVLDGILRIMMLALKFKRSEESTMLVGGFEIAFGIVLMVIDGGAVIDLIINFLAILIIVIGILFLGFSILAIVRKADKLFVPILEILFGAILIGLGLALIIIYHGDSVTLKNRLIFSLMGAMLAVAGGALAVATMLSHCRRKKEKKAAGKKPIDAMPAPSADPEPLQHKKHELQPIDQDDVIDVDVADHPQTSDEEKPDEESEEHSEE